MTNKHFEKIASIIRFNSDSKDENVDKIHLINDLSDFFSSENIRFDSDKFKNACN